MPKPIVLTEAMKQQARADFSAMLDSLKMSDGELSYNMSYSLKDCKAVVLFTQMAYRKILALVLGFQDEVAWHGIASRAGDSQFLIEDIFVYPQEVTDRTVITDQGTYTNWLYEFDDDTFNQIRMQGHSHVNMGVTPSETDDDHRQKILAQLESDMFYIFMIWNKSLSVHTLIYDMAQNVLYESDDVEIEVLDDEHMGEFLADATNKVRKPTHKAKAGQKPTCPSNWAAAGSERGREESEPMLGLYDPYYW